MKNRAGQVWAFPNSWVALIMTSKVMDNGTRFHEAVTLAKADLPQGAIEVGKPCPIVETLRLEFESGLRRLDE